MRWLLLSLCLSACGYLNKGDPCVTGGANIQLCNTDLVCCAADPRVADQRGVCVEEKTLANAGDACGVAANKCCALGLVCEVNTQTGDGKCVK